MPNKLFLWFGALPFTRRLNTDEFVGIMVGSFYCCRCVLPLVVRDRYPADPHEAVTRKSRCLTEDFRSATDMFAPQPIRAPTPVGASQGCVSLVARRNERNSPKRRFFWELFFAPFVSKKSGVSVCALQNRCSKATQTVSTLFLFVSPVSKKTIPHRLRRSSLYTREPNNTPC